MKCSTLSPVSIGAIILINMIGFTTFGQKTSKNQESRGEDSIQNNSSTFNKAHKRGSNWNDKDLELQLNNLDGEMKKLDIELKKIDFSKMQKNLDESLKKIDYDDVNKQVDDAIKRIDFDKIQERLNESVVRNNKISMHELRKEMKKLKADLRKEKLQQISVPKIDQEKIKVEVEKALKDARQSIEQSKLSIGKSRVELQRVNELVKTLEADGLIDKSKPYTIELRAGELYINDQKQSKAASEKYRKLYWKEDFTIHSTDQDGIRI